MSSSQRQKESHRIRGIVGRKQPTFTSRARGDRRCIRKTVRLLARSSGHKVRKLAHIAHPDIRLMWSFAEWPVVAVDEGGVHSGRFCPDAIEGVVGHEEDLV